MSCFVDAPFDRLRAHKEAQSALTGSGHIGRVPFDRLSAHKAAQGASNRLRRP